ncbi:MAG: Transporter [Edaphobacter sp.]|nr:Transporter [Edaphobacter sp.]
MQRTLVTLLGLMMLLPAAFAQKSPSPAEQTLLQLANQRRAEHNLAPLAWDAALTRAARTHAQRMIQGPGEIQHQYPGEPDVPLRVSQAEGHFSIVLENIAAAQATPGQIAEAWMNSPSHRANILDQRMNFVGIAVIDDHGVLYAVEDFGRNVPAPRLDEVEDRARQLLSDRGIKFVESPTSKEDARKSCETRSSPPNALIVMQWDGPDINQLPVALFQQVPQARDHTAAVGVCPGARSSPDFTTYHVAVLLY